MSAAPRGSAGTAGGLRRPPNGRGPPRPAADPPGRRRRPRARPRLAAGRRGGRRGARRRPRQRRDRRGRHGVPGRAAVRRAADRGRRRRGGARGGRRPRRRRAGGAPRGRRRRRARRGRVPGLRARARPPPGSRAARRSAARSPRRPGSRWPRGGAFAALDPARAFAAELAAGGNGVVVKADGLAAGKGVTVCDTTAEAEAALAAIFAGERRRPVRPAGAPRVVVEERLEGPEASVIAICDGARRAGPARRPRPQAPRRRRRRAQHRAAWAPTRRCRTSPTRSSRTSWRASTARRCAELAAARHPVPGRAVRRPHADRRPRPGPPRVQRPLRRPGDAGDPAAARGARSAPLLLAAAEGRLRRGRGRPRDRGGRPAGDPRRGRGDRPREPRLPGSAFAPGDPIAGLDGGAPRAARLVFHAGTRRRADGGWETDGGRVLAVVGQGRRARGRPGGRRRASRTRVTFAGRAVAPRHRDGRRSRRRRR